MNLYEIKFIHYSPKDSKEGIVSYLIAKDDEQVYEWMKEGVENSTGYEHHTNYKDAEEDGDLLDDKPFKESIIESQGCATNDYVEVSDLYYGATIYHWESVKENISQSEIDVLADAGINIKIANLE